MENWDPVAFKALLRTTSQRLGQLQEREDSQGKLARRDIAAHLSQGQLGLARAKAATLIQEDAMGDLLEELEMLVGTVGRHIGELGGGARTGLSLGEDVNRDGQEEDGRVGELLRLSPVLVEAAASIIHAAPTTESKDLGAVREVLIQRLGPTFTQTASASRNNHVSPRITQILSSPPPTASKMNAYLVNIAQTHGVKWAPEPRREDLLNAVSEILRVGAGSSPIVDLPRLRAISARGLPDDPPWVRPRIWRLLFGTLPILKTTWAKETQKQRDSYYDLVRRLLSPLTSLSSPTTTLSPTDALLSRIYDSLCHVSPDLFELLGNEPKGVLSGKCPLDSTAPDNIQITCASNLDKRISLLKGDTDAFETPEIRLETDLRGSDSASPPPPPSPAVTGRPASQRGHQRTTLLPSKAYDAPPAHRAHISALLRLLYIHSTLNPAIQSPHVPWLLIPLYTALVGETNENDAAHVEADTFWVFEALIGEVAELEEEDGGKIWTRKLSERIKWVDGALATSLHATGLDPIHPHYSYRWLAPLLAQTLPLSSLLPVWDVLFARPVRTRNSNPKLEHLVDICTALLVRARAPLFRLGKPGRDAPGLWSQEHAELRPPSPLRPWELSDAFTQGMALLTTYPIEAAGGIDRILQTASDLAQKRIEARDKEIEQAKGNVGFGARITQRMWKGFTNQVGDGSPDEEEVEEEEEEEEMGEHEDGNETETPAVSTLTSRLANTVWRGITNQSSMDDEMPSPPSPSSARHSPTPEERQAEILAPSSQPSLWNYAGKLKDSDTIAAFSKVGTNFRAKALDVLRVRKESDIPTSSKPLMPKQPPLSSSASLAPPRQSGWPDFASTVATGQRRGSLPGTPHESEYASLDPPRPAFFRSPRESFLPQPRRQHATAPSSPVITATQPSPRDSDTESSTSFMRRAGTSLASLTTLSSSHSSPKSVPRPLMLSSRDLISNKSSQPPSSTHSDGGTPEYRRGTGQWGDVLSATKNRHALKQESVSSTSSLSLSEAMNKRAISGGYARSTGTGPRSDYDSDGSAVAASRKVPLNRKSVSPMALASRSPNLPWNVPSPVAGRSVGHPLSNGSLTADDVETPSSERGWRHFDSEERGGANGATVPGTGMGTATGFDSPTTIASPPIPHTPLMPAVPGPGIVRIVDGGSNTHCATSSISTLSETSEANVPSLEAPPPSRLLVRKKTPPLPPAFDGEAEGERNIPRGTLPSSESEELSMERTPSGKAPVRLRAKRYATRPGNLRLRSPGPGVGTADQRTPSPGQQNLTAEWPGEFELATTPRADSYLASRGEGEGADPDAVASRPPYVRKTSKEARLRKVSPGGNKRVRASAAEEGDDEGYDELLSAYESEEGSRE